MLHPCKRTTNASYSILQRNSVVVHRNDVYQSTYAWNTAILIKITDFFSHTDCSISYFFMSLCKQTIKKKVLIGQGISLIQKKTRSFFRKKLAFLNRAIMYVEFLHIKKCYFAIQCRNILNALHFKYWIFYKILQKHNHFLEIPEYLRKLQYEQADEQQHS